VKATRSLGPATSAPMPHSQSEAGSGLTPSLIQ